MRLTISDARIFGICDASVAYDAYDAYVAFDAFDASVASDASDALTL